MYWIDIFVLITNLLNISLKTGTFSKLFKNAIVTIVFISEENTTKKQGSKFLNECNVILSKWKQIDKNNNKFYGNKK